MFLTYKRAVRIKGRACIYGGKQCAYIRKEDAASPTVSLDYIIITSEIETHIRRDVATIDIPGAYIHKELYEDVIMIIKKKIGITVGEYITKNTPEICCDTEG